MLKNNVNIKSLNLTTLMQLSISIHTVKFLHYVFEGKYYVPSLPVHDFNSPLKLSLMNISNIQKNMGNNITNHTPTT